MRIKYGSLGESVYVGPRIIYAWCTSL